MSSLSVVSEQRIVIGSTANVSATVALAVLQNATHSSGTPSEIFFVFNVCIAALFVIGILGNLFVIAIILFCLRLKNVSNVFIFNLAIADFLYLVWIPLVIVKNVNHEWLWGQAVCKLYNFCTGINRWGSALFLTMLCVDRYLAVCHPIKMVQYRTVKMALVMVFLCWLLVMALMSPLIMSASVQPELQIDHRGNVTVKTQCAIYWIKNEIDPSTNLTVINQDVKSRRVFTLYTVCSSTFFMVVTWLLYSCILFTLRAKSNRVNSASASRKKTTRKVTRMVFAVLVCYTVCWTPMSVVTILMEYFPSAFENFSLNSFFAVMFFSYSLNYLNSASNPILYTFLSGTYRKIILERCFGVQEAVNEQVVDAAKCHAKRDLNGGQNLINEARGSKQISNRLSNSEREKKPSLVEKLIPKLSIASKNRKAGQDKCNANANAGGCRDHCDETAELLETFRSSALNSCETACSAQKDLGLIKIHGIQISKECHDNNNDIVIINENNTDYNLVPTYNAVYN